MALAVYPGPYCEAVRWPRMRDCDNLQFLPDEQFTNGLVNELKLFFNNDKDLLYCVKRLNASFEGVNPQNLIGTQCNFLGLSIFKNGESQDSPSQIPTENPVYTGLNDIFCIFQSCIITLWIMILVLTLMWIVISLRWFILFIN